MAINIRPASRPWWEAAKRLTGESVVVAFGDHLPGEQSAATVFRFKGETVILILDRLGFQRKISVLIHECAHLKLDRPGELMKFRGKWRFVGKFGISQIVPEYKVEEVEASYFANEYLPRLEKLKRTTPRPSGWWTGDYAPNMFRQWERDHLSCV